jgi:hypothetical protein
MVEDVLIKVTSNSAWLTDLGDSVDSLKADQGHLHVAVNKV